MNPHRTYRSGFTLLEVLVALAITVMAITVLGAGYVNVIKGYRAVEESSFASPDIAFARQQVLLAPTLEEAERAGDSTRPNGAPLRWRARIEPARVANLFRVTLEIELGEPPPASANTVVQTFWVLQPSWSEADAAARLREDFRKRIEDGRRFQ
jgi:general secretion pathway protein I